MSGFSLNTGRLRDQWHTMTRTGQAPSLSGHNDLPIIQINHVDAEAHQVIENQLLRISSEHGHFIGAAKLCDDVKRGELFSAIHWNEQFATDSVVTSVISPIVDPVSGQPEFKASRVNLAPFDCESWARVASTSAIEKGNFDYWAQTKTKRGYITLLGSNEKIDWRQWSESQLDSDVHFTQFSDAATGAQTLLAVEQRLDCVVGL